MTRTTTPLKNYRRSADETAKAQRDLQKAVDRQPVRRRPASRPTKLPRQHLTKPGLESRVKPAPRFAATDYRGSGKLDGKVAVITGADSGIGRAVAVLFAREGADVAIFYLNEHSDAEVTSAAVRAEGRQCLLVPGDVRDSSFCVAGLHAVMERFGKIDIVVNNAAFQLHTDDLANLTDAHFDMTMRTNIYGYFHMARSALKHLGRGACIINTGSETGLFGAPGIVDYAATKGAIHAFTLSLATQLAPRGIRVNAVAPGPVWTPLNPSDRPATKVPEFGTTTTLARPAQPDEIAPAYVFLAAECCSSYITGIVLPIMGGVHGSG